MRRFRILDNDHPYGVRVAPSGPPTPEVTRALEEAREQVDAQLARLDEELDECPQCGGSGFVSKHTEICTASYACDACKQERP